MARPRFAPWTLRLAEQLLARPQEATRDKVEKLANEVWLQYLQLQREYQAKNGGYHPMDATRALGYLAYRQFRVSRLSPNSEREAINGVFILHHDGPSAVVIPIVPAPEGLGYSTDILHDIFDRIERIMI